MARVKKTQEVAKFGGIDELGSTRLHGHRHDVSSGEALSQTHLEDDRGEGEAVIVRCFEFGMNPEAFHKAKSAGMTVTKQDLFNAHYKGIEVALWKDGLKAITSDEIKPRVVIDEKRMKYSIFVTARPRKGYALLQKPHTLREVIHG